MMTTTDLDITTTTKPKKNTKKKNVSFLSPPQPSNNVEGTTPLVEYTSEPVVYMYRAILKVYGETMLNSYHNTLVGAAHKLMAAETVEAKEMLLWMINKGNPDHILQAADPHDTTEDINKLDIEERRKQCKHLGCFQHPHDSQWYGCLTSYERIDMYNQVYELILEALESPMDHQKTQNILVKILLLNRHHKGRYYACITKLPLSK